MNISILTKIAKIKKLCRNWFEKQNFLEVETPSALPHWTTEPYLTPFQTTSTDDKGVPIQLYMIPSPEFSLKKILSMGGEKIFEFAKCYRNGESRTSKIHNHEFTMLEFYETNSDYNHIMKNTIDLIVYLAENISEIAAPTNITYNKKNWDLTQIKKVTLEDAFLTYAKIDFKTFSSWDDFRKIKKSYIPHGTTSLDDIFYLIFLNEVEGPLIENQCVLLCDYPAFQAAFSTTFMKNNLLYAERFELYLGGIEIANGYSELCDSSTIKSRLEENQKISKEIGNAVYPYDPEFPKAAGEITSASGIAVGFDRLAMFLLDAKSIGDVRFLG